MPLDIFRNQLHIYMGKCNLRKKVWNEEFYAVPFADRGLTLEVVESFPWPPGSTSVLLDCTVVKGVSLKIGRPGQAQEVDGDHYAQQQPTHSAQKGKGPNKKAVSSTYAPIPTIK